MNVGCIPKKLMHQAALLGTLEGEREREGGGKDGWRMLEKG